MVSYIFCLITDYYVSFIAPELNTLWKTEGDIPEIETPVVQDSEPEEDDDELEESESSLVSQNQNNSTQTKVIDKNIGSHKRPLEEELQNEGICSCICF